MKTLEAEYEAFKQRVYPGLIDEKLEPHLKRFFAAGVIVSQRRAAERGQPATDMHEAAQWANSIA